MKSCVPKVLHQLAGKSLIQHVLDKAAALGSTKTLVVLGSAMEAVKEHIAPCHVVVQQTPRGTADAVMAARAELQDFRGDVLVLYGDTPMVSVQTLKSLIKKHTDSKAAVTITGMRPEDPGAYGRIILNADGTVQKIVEYAEANDTERAQGLCNGGLILADRETLFDLLQQVDNKNKKGEYYLTDIVSIANKNKKICSYVDVPYEEMAGINSKTDLAAAEAIMQQNLRAQVLEQGVTLLDAPSVFFSTDTKLGRDVVIEPHVFFGPGVTIGDGVVIKGFSHLEGVQIGNHAIIGPFARLRPETILGDHVRVGNFVEIKKSVLKSGVKASHLSYIGDTDIAEDANIGAGTITCNYDGTHKHKTTIGKNAFIGSNTALVAPVTIGDGALIGAGSTITRDVTAHSLAVTRAPQKTFPKKSKG